MRLGLVILVVAVLLVASGTSARWLNPYEIPEEMKNNPPPGSHWDEEAGLFALDNPVPLMPPQKMSLTIDEDEIYFDDAMVRYYAVQQEGYYAVLRFPTPSCGERKWVLTAAWVGVYNIDMPPDPGELVVYDHEPGNCLGDVLGIADFSPDAYIGEGLPAQWQQVDFYPWVPITEPEFWIAWDYRPGTWEPSVYSLGFLGPGVPEEEQLRSHEVGFFPCPLSIPEPYVWLIRAFGHCDGPMTGHPIDIKPQSCPNPLGVKDKGVIPMAILGTNRFNVYNIDPATVRLDGDIVPLRWAYEDVAEPFPGELCDCWTKGADGYVDLTLKFSAPEVVRHLGDIENGDILELTLSWTLYDGTQMSGSDCMIVRDGGKGPQDFADRTEQNSFALFQNSPNPFRRGTRICFSLPEKRHTTLTVHDVTGRLVSVVADGEFSAGAHTVEWTADVPAGVYFYRIAAGELAAGRRMVVLR